MMKKLISISILSGTLLLAACNDVRREPGHVYMPDMAYSRAYETYDARDSTKFTENATHPGDKIFYDNMPVTGTVARGEEIPFSFAKDMQGDTTNYYASRQVQNPVPALDEKDMKEAERLYLINCGICHGTALDGNGPLYKGGEGPFPAAPKNLSTLDMPDGQMFYSITYGKNLMGSYASQLTRQQRWEIIHYIRSKQKITAKSTAAANAAPAKDSTAAKP